MGKYAWCSDIHLDHIDDDARLVAFANSLIANDPIGIFVTGDISNAKRLVYHLSVIEKVVQRHVFFVLGNHDFYGGDIVSVRKSMHELSNISPFLRYLALNSYIPLSKSTALVGHDGWYDALYGDGDRSWFMMTDWYAIKDYVSSSGGEVYMNMMRTVKDKAELVALSRKLAHEGVVHVMNGIKSAVRYHKNIIVLTHFPPFRESHIHNGRIGNDSAQPWFTSKMFGDMMLQASATYPDVSFRVFCGHTHGKFDGQITKNLSVHVAGAQYGNPNVSALVDVT
jgi:predicted MPP superfamily phosphohydrolase